MTSIPKAILRKSADNWSTYCGSDAVEDQKAAGRECQNGIMRLINICNHSCSDATVLGTPKKTFNPITDLISAYSPLSILL